MARNKSAGIQIGQLNLRIPGAGGETVDRLANAIAEGLAREIPGNMNHHLGMLSVRVQTAAQGAEMSGAITDSIVSALSKDSSKSTGGTR